MGIKDFLHTIETLDTKNRRRTVHIAKNEQKRTLVFFVYSGDRCLTDFRVPIAEFDEYIKEASMELDNDET